MSADSTMLIIIRAFYSTFVILLGSENSGRNRRNFSKFLDCFVIVCILSSAGGDSYIIYHQFDNLPVGVIISAMSGYILSLGLRIILLKKSKTIVSTVDRIIHSHRLSRQKSKEKVILVTGFSVSWIIPSLMFLGVIKVVMSENGGRRLQSVVFYGSHWDETWLTLLAVLIKYISMQQMYALPGCCLVLCFYASRLLTTAIKKAERRMKTKLSLEEVFVSYVKFSQKISRSIENVEASLSLILMLIYCYLMSCIFIVITMIIKVWPKQVIQDGIIINGSIFVMALFAFFALSTQGVGVHNAAIDLKNTIYVCCAKLSVSMEPQDEEIRVLILAMADAFQDKTQITVWNFFSLNKGFILQTTGAMVSYGLIVAQLG